MATDKRDQMLARMSSNYVETLIQLVKITHECGFDAEEAALRDDLARARDQLWLVLCSVDGEPRQRVAAMLEAVTKALGA
jgi:hypothetical protein